MVVYCALYGCESTSRDENRRFFRFPKDEIRCKQWIQASGRPELSKKSSKDVYASYYICDLHFENSDHMKKKLKRNAIPTQNLPKPQISNPSKLTQTEDSLKEMTTVRVSIQTMSNSTQTGYGVPSASSNFSQTNLQLSANKPRKRKLTIDLNTETKRRKCLETKLKAVSSIKKNIVSPHLQNLLDLQYRIRRNGLGNRFNRKFNLFSLNVYFASPLAYRVLAKTLSLPSERTLRRMNINTGTKLQANVLQCLKSKMQSLQESERYCLICASVISLKRNLYYQINEDKIVGFHEIDGIQTIEPASHAFVVMGKGIFSNWKQQLGYCFLAKSQNYKELNSWLNDLISKLFNIGLKIVAFVSDQGSTFFKIANERSVSSERPYFYIDGKKIYYIFDVPHLIKSLRNSWMKHDFEFFDTEGTKYTANWEDIKQFYIQDSKRSYRLAPKLTESHIFPNNFEKMRVKYATQIFSHSVAAAMNCTLENGQLEDRSIGTIKFIGLIDKAFDILNSSTVHNLNRYKIAFASKQHQTDVLDELESVLLKLNVFDKLKKNITNSIKCINGLKLSIKSIKSLALDLKSEGFNFIFTRRLNQDALQIFFGSIRQQGGNFRKPTPIQFSRAFKKSFMVNILKHSEHANCSEDLDQLLMRTDDIENLNLGLDDTLQIVDTQQSSLSSIIVETVDYRFDLPRKNAFTYVCAYLLKKCYEVHHCEDIDYYIAQTKKLKDEFIERKSLNQNAMVLITPKSFVAYIKLIDDKFQKCFQQNKLNLVGNAILKELRDFSFDDCCSCFPNLYLKKLFLRFRIFTVIRFNNRKFKDKSLRHIFFSMCNL